jgi:hypothetical protein
VSRQKAINDKCRDCIYDPLAPGNWRQQTGACTIRTCSLWPYRPVSTPRRNTSQRTPKTIAETASGGRFPTCLLKGDTTKEAK